MDTELEHLRRVNQTRPGWEPTLTADDRRRIQLAVAGHSDRGWKLRLATHLRDTFAAEGWGPQHNRVETHLPELHGWYTDILGGAPEPIGGTPGHRRKRYRGGANV